MTTNDAREAAAPQTCAYCAVAIDGEAAAGGVPIFQPIREAPKNGAGILALLPGSNFPVGIRWDDGRWCVAWDNHPLGELDQPVKFMRIPDEDARSPLPQQPTAEGVDSQGVPFCPRCGAQPDEPAGIEAVAFVPIHPRCGALWANVRDAAKEAGHKLSYPERPLIFGDTRPSPVADGVDAQRYRLLRRGQHWSVVNGVGDTLRADELDAAIDSRRLTGADHA